MYLKRLELRGFKSFASPITFEFGSGVTCVIGPNGSGKTNVAEALRWVLGEHASRVIRARKTEDVIFSGSAKRPAVGMAEAAITLDNSEAWLPLDFAEVVVSRRAYRSGENEYFINQSRVRLKDVADLFLKAQVGQNSYAFMGQGLVEEVLTLRPEDRRGLIEEAADVKLHRTKLDEAHNRLQATRDNLERVALLVAEIAPRLRQLERQADRAGAHARLSAELSQALRAWYGEQWQDAQEALAAARAACDQRQEEAERAKRDVVAVDEGAGALSTAIEDGRREISERLEAHRALEDYRRDLQRRITLDEERLAMLTSRREELTGEIESLTSERADLSALVATQQERAESLETDLTAAREPSSVDAEARESEARLQALQQALAEAERQLRLAQARLSELDSQSASLERERERLGAEIAAFAEARREPLALLKGWAREFALRQHRARELGPAVQDTTRQLAQTEARLRAAEANVSRHQDELHRLSVEIDSGQARLDAIEDRDIDLPSPDAAIKALLAHGGLMPGQEPPADNRIHNMLGVLGQLLRVPAGLERAIEAALADALHAVIVESHEDALAAVELLVSEDLGRATVLSLNDVRAAPPVNLMEERGVLGVASELVKCEHRYRPLVETLLGRTIVVQNLGTGKALLRRGLGSVVTVDGIMLRPMGAMTAGSAKAVRTALSHQREAGELPGELERLRAAHGETSAALEREKAILAEARQSRDRLATDLSRLRSDLAQADDALRHHRPRFTPLATHLSSSRARRGDARTALDEARAALDNARREAERARADLVEHSATVERLRGEIETHVAAREGVLRAASERRAGLAALESEQRAVDQHLATQNASLARAQQELTRREELSTRLDEELRAVRGRLEVARRELEEKAREADVAREELEPARHALEQIESRQRTITDELAAARANALTSERALLDADASVRLREEELAALRERLEEEGFRPSPEGDDLLPPEESSNGDQPPAWLTTERRGPESGLPPVLGGAGVDPVALKEHIGELRAEIRSLGPVNEQAQTDYEENRERHDYLSTQLTDLREAEASIQEAMVELERIVKQRFSTTFEQVNLEFRRYFETFFGGGQAELVLTRTDDDNGLPGVDILAQPPRKRVRTLNMLSGGERSLTAVALLFALLHIHPSPICVLDEVDAALDEANVGRFTGALRELAERTQFIIITHNRRTIEIADTIYGVSMGEDSTSSVLSLRLSDVPVN
ncbi:MAG: chromosome segregation protein SMC [Dehalococcoidia bacterium]